MVFHQLSPRTLSGPGEVRGPPLCGREAPARPEGKEPPPPPMTGEEIKRLPWAVQLHLAAGQLPLQRQPPSHGPTTPWWWDASLSTLA